MRPLAILLGGLAFLACTSNGYKEGDSCDPTVSGRDCQEGLTCIYSHDECPQYGCPRCRRPCETDTDCSGAGATCSEPKCVRQSNNTQQSKGVCSVCKTDPYYGPP